MVSTQTRFTKSQVANIPSGRTVSLPRRRGPSKGNEGLGLHFRQSEVVFEIVTRPTCFHKCNPSRASHLIKYINDQGARSRSTWLKYCQRNPSGFWWTSLVAPLWQSRLDSVGGHVTLRRCSSKHGRSNSCQWFLQHKPKFYL